MLSQILLWNAFKILNKLNKIWLKWIYIYIYIYIYISKDIELNWSKILKLNNFKIHWKRPKTYLTKKIVYNNFSICVKKNENNILLCTWFVFFLSQLILRIFPYWLWISYLNIFLSFFFHTSSISTQIFNYSWKQQFNTYFLCLVSLSGNPKSKFYRLNWDMKGW